MFEIVGGDRTGTNPGKMGTALYLVNRIIININRL